MAAILFIAPDDLSEAVLATGALAHVLQEGDVLTIVASPEAAQLFRAAPGPTHTHLLPPRAGAAALWRVWLELNKASFDVAIDARGGFLGRTIRTARSIGLKPGPVVRHLTEDWADAVGAERALAPKLWLDETARASAASAAPPEGAPLLVLAPGGVTGDKRWPGERFAAVARRLAGGPLAGAGIVVLGAAVRDADVASAIVQSLDSDGVEARDLGIGGDLLAAAALAERATLCVGNDNALTHIAAAMGAATLTLFGPTDERVRAPCGPRTRSVRGRSLQAVAALGEADRGVAMEDIGIDAVEAAALDLLHAGGLR